MYEFKTRPYDHQKTALKCSRDRAFYAYLMEMGTGKTKVAIDEMGVYHSEGKIDCAIVIAPKGVYMNWVRNEIPVHLGIPHEVVYWVSGGGNKNHQAALKKALQPRSDVLRILVVNIEALSTAGKARRYVRMFAESGRCYAAVDESTTIKNHSANRTKAVIEIGSLCTYRRIMTGSPVTKSPLDLYSQFEFLSPGALGSRSFYAFRARYAVMQQKVFGGRKVQIVVGHRNLEDLTDRLQRHSFRVRKEECLDLPEKVYTSRDVELTEEQQRVYREMSSEAFAELSGGGFASAASAITMILRLHQITCGHVVDADGSMNSLSTNRISVLMDVLSETQNDVIIWANYRDDIRRIREAIHKEYGEESLAEFHGGNTDTRVGDADRFINSSECRFMLSNQQSGAYGNTWVNAKTVVYYSNNFDLEKRLQSEDRAHRSGQTDNVTYVDLIARGTVDERIVRALRNKIDIASTILGEEPQDWLV